MSVIEHSEEEFSLCVEQINLCARLRINANRHTKTGLLYSTVTQV